MDSNYTIKDNTAIISINKEIYSKEIIMQATYVKLDEFYFLVDLVEGYFKISMKFKDGKKSNEDLKQAVLSFYDELIESASYIDQLKRTSKVRETILETALLAQQGSRTD